MTLASNFASYIQQITIEAALRSRTWHGQFRELTRKCIVHNLTQAAS